MIEKIRSFLSRSDLSLSHRILISASLVLFVLIGVSWYLVDSSYQNGLVVAKRDQLQSQIFSLLAAFDLDKAAQVKMPDYLPDSRFSLPESGIYAQISDAEGKVLWRSGSHVSGEIIAPLPAELGTLDFYEEHQYAGQPVFLASFSVVWETESNGEIQYVFSVAESKEQFFSQLGAFRQKLFYWVFLALVILLGFQGLILSWGLAPLRKIAAQVRDVEKGLADHLAGPYPKELQGLAENLNGLINSEKARRERFKNSLGDLAHSLKTPLAILQNFPAQNLPTDLHTTLQEQVMRMREIVELQLQRAAASGGARVGKKISVREVAEKIIRTLEKVYQDKPVSVVNEIEADCFFYGDQGDLMECLGNLLDNAFKWANTQIRIQGKRPAAAKDAGLVISIEDDGPGIPDHLLTEVLQRGVRADNQVAGHGLGLSMVKNLLDAYEGSLDIGRSSLGGASIQIEFP